MSKSRILRILHAPTTVGGHPQGLARAERELGALSHSAVLRQNYFAYPADEVLVPSWLPAALGSLASETAAWWLLLRACHQVDIVHLNFGGQLIPTLDPALLQGRGALHRLYQVYGDLCAGLDLKLLRRSRTGIAVTFQGDDARQGDVCRQRFPFSIAHEVGDGYYTAASDAAKRRAIARIDRYADRIYYLNPDLGWVLPARARFVPYAHIDLRDWRPTSVANPRPLVLHAPTHRTVKGTRFILAAVATLKAEGLDFDFQLVEHMSHAAARRLYENADLLVDQLLAGWYGGLAVELMALGKPVICHLRHGDFGFLPPAMHEELPLIDADPETITDTLRHWIIADHATRSAQGARSRAFVERWHNPLHIAAGLLDEYTSIHREIRHGADQPCAG